MVDCLGMEQVAGMVMGGFVAMFVITRLALWASRPLRRNAGAVGILSVYAFAVVAAFAVAGVGFSDRPGGAPWLQLVIYAVAAAVWLVVDLWRNDRREQRAA